MASQITLPVEIRLKIYELLLAEWDSEPAIFSPRGPGVGETIEQPRVRVPVPAVSQAEAGEVRSRLLQWLTKHTRVVPAESTPTLRFHDREFDIQHDFLFLKPHYNTMDIRFLQSRNRMMRHISWNQLRPRAEPEAEIYFLGMMPRRIAMLSPTCCGTALPLLLRELGWLRYIRELAFAFVELDDGELKLIHSAPKMNPAAYTLEPLRDGDIKENRRDLLRSVEGLRDLIWDMILDEWEIPVGKTLPVKITACKLIPRI